MMGAWHRQRAARAHSRGSLSQGPARRERFSPVTAVLPAPRTVLGASDTSGGSGHPRTLLLGGLHSLGGDKINT